MSPVQTTVDISPRPSSVSIGGLHFQAMDIVCSTTATVGTRLHWSTGPPTCVWREGMVSVVEGRRSMAGELKHTGQRLLNTLMRIHLSRVLTHTHTLLRFYGLNPGPTEGLSLCWLSSQQSPKSHQ